MTKKLIMSASIALALSAPLCGFGVGQCCDASCCWEVGAELLYMKPSRCDFEYAVLDPRPYVPITGQVPPENTEMFGPMGTIKGVEPEFDAGFRVILGRQFGCDCYDACLIYTRLHTRQVDTIRPSPESGGIWASELISSDTSRPGGSPFFFQTVLFNPSGNAALPFEVGAFARGTQKFWYDAAELQLAARTIRGCKFWTRGFVGVHFVFLDQLFDVLYQGTQHPGVTSTDNQLFQSRAIFAKVRRLGQTWGFGPRIGVEGIYDVACCFGIAGQVGVSLLAGEAQAKYSQHYVSQRSETGQLFEDRLYNVKTGQESLVIPEFDARLGVNYRTCWCGMQFDIQAGWEWLAYIYMVPVGPRFRMDKGISQLDCETFTLNGLYIRLIGSF